MATLNVAVPHHLSPQDASQRVKELLQDMKNTHADKISDLREEWTDDGAGFSFTAMGFPLSGTIAVTPTQVEVSGNLPLAASFFKHRIETTIRERLVQLLA